MTSVKGEVDKAVKLFKSVDAVLGLVRAIRLFENEDGAPA
jgi:hypothetical protein